MSYLDKETLEYGLSEQAIRAANPDYSPPVPFAPPPRYALVFDVPQPEHDAVTQVARQLAPVLTDKGHWQQQWEVVPRFETEADADAAVAADLELRKAGKRAEINEARLAANFSTFTHAGKVFACDQLSRSDIDGTNGFVAIYGALPPGWPGGWKAMDNTYLPITTVADWKAFYSSMFATGSANFAKSQGLKAQVESATTAEEINSIGW